MADNDDKKDESIIGKAKARFNRLKLQFPLLLAAGYAYACFEESADVVSDILWVVSLQNDMEPWIHNVNKDGSELAYPTTWRLTSSGDLAFLPGKVGQRSTTDNYFIEMYANAETPVVDVFGNTVRRSMCGDSSSNPFSSLTRFTSGYCEWSHDFSSRPGYKEEKNVCIKFERYYDLDAAVASLSPISDKDEYFIPNAAEASYNFLPSFETATFDDKSYYSTIQMDRVKVNVQLDMRKYKRAGAVKYKPGSTTEYADDSMMQEPVFCNRLNSVYIGTMVIFSFTMILWIGKVTSLTYALATAMYARRDPIEMHENMISYPFIGALYPFYMLLSTSRKEELKKIEERNQNDNGKNKDTVTSRLLGLRAWMSSELACGSFTFTSTMCDPARWEKYGTMDHDGNPRKSVKLWEAICYPLVLPFSSTFFNAISASAVRNPCTWVFWPLYVATAWGYSSLCLANVVLMGTWSITFFSDHSVTIKIIEDFPQMVIGYYYITNVKPNNDAMFSATLSLLILTKEVIKIALSVKNEATKEIVVRNTQKERALHRMYGDLTLGQAMWVTCMQPVVVIFIIWPGIFMWFVHRRKVPESTPNVDVAPEEVSHDGDAKVIIENIELREHVAANKS